MDHAEVEVLLTQMRRFIAYKCSCCLRGDEEERRECFVRVCIAILRNAHNIRGTSIGEHISYLNQVIRTTVTDIRRERARERVHIAEAAEADVTALRDKSPLPDERFRISEQLDRITDAYTKLTLREQEIFRQYFVEEKTTLEVSQSLGIAEGNVKARVFMIRQKLKKLLEDKP